jgi:hypothetical protein
VPITRSVLGARPKIYARRESDLPIVRTITVDSDAALGTNQHDDAVQQACLSAKKAEQERLEAVFGKTRNSSDVQDF